MMRFAVNSGRGNFALDAQFDAPEAGICVLFGPSGSGKTSFLRALCGLDCAQGQIYIAGENVLPKPAHERGVGLVFQDARLFEHLNVARNLDYAEARARGKSLPRQEIVQALGIEKLLARDCASLSGGERQRVAIARALLAGPRLLAMDEPVSALDLKARAEILALIAQLPKLAGIPVLYVTHAIEEAARIGDHMALIREGKIARSGPIADIFADPLLDEFTGHFEAGSLMEAQVLGFDAAFGLTTLAAGGGELEIPVSGLSKGAKLRLRIRARDVAVALEKPQGLSVRNMLACQLQEMRLEGAHAELLLACGPAQLRARITRASAIEMSLAAGKPLYALIKGIAVDRQLF